MRDLQTIQDEIAAETQAQMTAFREASERIRKLNEEKQEPSNGVVVTSISGLGQLSFGVNRDGNITVIADRGPVRDVRSLFRPDALAPLRDFLNREVR